MENGKTFVLLEKIRAFCADLTINHAQESTTHNDCTEPRTEINTTERTHYIVDKKHYEGLLIRLGQMESEKKYLLEYKEDLDRRDKELTETKATLSKANEALTDLVQYKQDAEQKSKALLDQQAEIERLEAEVEKLKRPWWQRIFQK